MYEIDAASNRGIEDIKELRDGARVLPFDSKYKVYIIDEVHMLSKDAWGALLKTLEEPPKHVIFILATTEMQKVPETIISRCQVFVFKKATDTVNKKMLIDVAKKEGFELDAGSAELLAILADGSFRDALGELQKVVNFSKGKVQKASAENLDMKLFLKLIVSKLRLAIILRYAPKLKNEMVGDLSEADIEFLQNVVKTDKEGMLRSGALAILLEAYQNIDNAFIAELPLELALVKILGKE
ncbi:MAG: polymerase III subunit gamma and tau protein [Candidatus Nomurabacteria bacterium GW2011_GWA2_40_97]|nr:MAG: polymerase III subunit gamma and tau protein [Candidatus Nomurabacteria bacterium GW2011_GWA2_40_97]